MMLSSSITVKPQSQKTFIDTVKDDLDSPLFAVTLKHNAPGAYDFGHIDHSKYTGELKYINVDNSEGFWMVSADGFAVGNGQTQSTSFRGIAGTSLFLVIVRGQNINLTTRHWDNPPDAPQRNRRCILQASSRSPAEPHGRRLHCSL